MGKGSLPALSTDHDAAHSLYDRKYPCNIHFDYTYLYLGSLHWEKKAGITIRQRIPGVPKTGSQDNSSSRRISLEILINFLFYTATTSLFSLNSTLLAFFLHIYGMSYQMPNCLNNIFIIVTLSFKLYFIPL